MTKLEVAMLIRAALREHSPAFEESEDGSCALWVNTSDGEVMIVVGSSTKFTRTAKQQDYTSLDNAIVEAVANGATVRADIYTRVRQELLAVWNPMGLEPMRILDSRLRENQRKGRIRRANRTKAWIIA